MTDTMCPIQRQAHRYLVEQSFVRPCECDDCASIKKISNTISEALKNMAQPRFMMPVPDGFTHDDDEEEVVN